LHDPNQVLDIRKKSQEQGATICMNERAQVGGIHQFWDLAVADPPKVVDPLEEVQDDSVKARLSAWFGNWLGWHTEKKIEVLDQSELHKAHEKVYKDNKSQIR
jgi:hypothetical protein